MKLTPLLPSNMPRRYLASSSPFLFAAVSSSRSRGMGRGTLSEAAAVDVIPTMDDNTMIA